MLGMGVFAQTTYSWRSEATNGNWNEANNWWNGSTSTTAVPNGGDILSFGNDNQLTMTNNLAATNRHQIIFTNSATQSRIISGTTENTFNKNGSNKPKIENNSSANQTIDFPLKWEYIANSAMELKPVSGDLTIKQAINNNGLWTDVLGGNGKTLSIASMSGAGGLSIKNNPTTVKITGTSTYTGNTYVNYGTLELQADVSSADIIVYNGAKLIVNGTDVDVQKLTINSGGTVEVLPGKSLTVNGVLTNNGILTLKSDANGTATIKTLGTVTNGGTTNYKVEQYLASQRNWYMSSPVTSTGLPSASTGTLTFYSYPENNDNQKTDGEGNPPAWIKGNYWETISSGTLAMGKGYVVRPSDVTTVTFSGSLNSGNYTINGLTNTSGNPKAGFNLVGNPYPSYLNWNSVTKTNVGNTMWYRTYTGSAYTFYTYNSIDGRGIGVPATVTNWIPPMQAFWVLVNTGQTGSLGLSNAMREHQDVAGNIFRSPALTNSDRQLIRLQVSNGSTSDELVIYSNANASNSYDAYDSPKMLNGSTSAVPDIYTIAGIEKLVINGLNTLPLDVVIPVSFAANNTVATSFTISANEISNLPSGVTVKVVDNSVETSLSDGGTYTFTADAGTTKTFGLILRSPGAITGVENGNADKFHVYANSNRQIVVNAPATTLVNVYNSIGQRITIQNMNGTSLQIDVPAAGVYLVNVGGNVYKVVAP